MHLADCHPAAFSCTGLKKCMRFSSFEADLNRCQADFAASIGIIMDCSCVFLGRNMEEELSKELELQIKS